jgi:acyl-CoA synthetase (AMP-forming)/AMP-acid ligase II
MATVDSQYTVKYASNLFCHSNAKKELIIDGAERYTGEQLNREARAIAQAFLSYGVSKGDTIALIGVSSCRFYAAYLAVHKLGAVACNIHVRESTTYITRTLDKVHAKLVVSEEKLLGTVAESIAALEKSVPLFSLGDEPVHGADAHYRKLIDEYPCREPEVNVSPDDPAVIILSSGSTGTPKGIVHSNGNFVRWLRVAPALFGAVSRSTRFLVNVGTSFAAWPFSSIPILYAGGCIILMDNFTPEGFCRAVESEGATMAGPVPTMIRLLEPAITNKYDLGSLKMILCAGEPPTDSDIDRVLSWADTDIRCLYLASESAPGAGTYWELNDAINLGKRVCAGKPVPGAEIRVVDPTGSITDLLPAGTEGEILLKGPTIAMCYLDDEALSREKFCDGWWRSSDLGSLDEDGYLTVSGRTDNIINTGGIKVQGEEVENCLIGHPCVSQVAVIGIADKKWGFRVEAHVSRSDDVSEDQLRQWCQTSGLASFKAPKTYVFHDKLPVGVTGKLDRVSLRDQYKDLSEESSSGSA